LLTPHFARDGAGGGSGIIHLEILSCRERQSCDERGALVVERRRMVDNADDAERGALELRAGELAGGEQHDGFVVGAERRELSPLASGAGTIAVTSRGEICSPTAEARSAGATATRSALRAIASRAAARSARIRATYCFHHQGTAPSPVCGGTSPVVASVKLSIVSSSEAVTILRAEAESVRSSIVAVSAPETIALPAAESIGSSIARERLALTATLPVAESVGLAIVGAALAATTTLPVAESDRSAINPETTVTTAWPFEMMNSPGSAASWVPSSTT